MNCLHCKKEIEPCGNNPCQIGNGYIHVGSLTHFCKNDKIAIPESEGLLEAVRNLYYAAVWTSDRLSTEEEAALWVAVRDAAGFAPGSSPKRKA